MNTLFDIALFFKDIGGWLEKGLTALLALIIGWTGGGATVMEAAQGKAIQATRREYVFDNGRLLLGSWNHGTAEDDIARWAKEAGLDFLITVLQPAKGGNETLEILKKYGLGGFELNYGEHSTLDQIDEDLLSTYWGELWADEPHARAFAALQKQVEAYPKEGRMQYINLLPNYAGPEALVDDWSISWSRYLLLLESPWSRNNLVAYTRYMAQYVSTVDTDYISMDCYPYTWDEDGNISTFNRWLFCLQTLAEACRDTGRDMWVITQAGGQSAGKNKDGVFAGTSLPEQNQQNFASLAFGAKAIVYASMKQGWFDDNSTMIDLDGQRTKTYYNVQAANKELTPFAEVYGDYTWKNAYLENMRRCAGMHYGILGLDFLPNNIWNLPNALPAEERLELVTGDGLLIGKFDKTEGDGSAWVITNMMELKESKSAQFTVRFDRPATVYLEGETQAYEAGLHSFTLAPGGGMFVAM
jgi:hypothetical protein